MDSEVTVSVEYDPVAMLSEWREWNKLEES